MQPFDVQSIAIAAPADVVFRYVADRFALPDWTHAFTRVDAHTATLETPAGAVDIRLEVLAYGDCGSVDWIMTFPDHSVGRAHARVVNNTDGSSILCFVLLAPPVPQEQIEGTLEQQRKILRSELARVRQILER
ncbi:MAG TPA: hypothetical protein VLD59_16675 [Steroidobacteraceae bacterium]|nr:hypothetical protein [Steroidobacteraceae bacterium]